MRSQVESPRWRSGAIGFRAGWRNVAAGAAKVAGALREEEINQLKRTAPRSREFHFDDESDLAEFLLVSL